MNRLAGLSLLLDANQSRVPMIGSGSAVMQAMATLGKEDDLNDLFMEINASDLSVEFGEIRMQSEDLIVFLTPREKDDFSVNSYSISLSMMRFKSKEPTCVWRFRRFRRNPGKRFFPRTDRSLPTVTPKGLTLPFWDLNLSESPAFPVGVKKRSTLTNFPLMTKSSNFTREALRLPGSKMEVWFRYECPLERSMIWVSLSWTFLIRVLSR